MESPKAWLLFIGLSFLAHGLILLLVMLPSNTESSAESSSASQTAARRQQQSRSKVPRERIARATSQVQRVSIHRINQRLETLRQIERELAAIEAKKNEEYERSTEPLKTNAVANAKGAMEKAVSLQENVIEELEAGASVFEPLMQEYDVMLRDMQMPPPLSR